MKLESKRLSDELLNISTDGYIETYDKSLYSNYEPTPYPMLNLLFRKYPFGNQSCLVDIGCGLGRTVFVAAYYGCPKVYGIEINKSLFLRLNDNYKRFSHLKKMQSSIFLLNFDIMVLEIDNSMNIFYFYNPFHLKIFIATINKIESSLREVPREVFIYLFMPHNSYTKYMERNKKFRLIENIVYFSKEYNSWEYTSVYKSI